MSSESNAEAIEWLLEHEERALTAWEVDFLESIQDRPRLSPKQQACLDRIWREVVVEKRA